jgi:hypothetical protein
MKYLICLILVSCSAAQVNHCPVDSAKVALDCREAVRAGKMTKEQCYQLIEESCQ